MNFFLLYRMPEELSIVDNNGNEPENICNNSSQQPNWLMDPTVYLDEYLTGAHLIFGAIGIPSNLFVGGFIISLERLHTPRNLLWIGVGFSNLFILIFHILEVLTVQLSSSILGDFCAWIKHLPDLTLLLNAFLSLLERYLCVKHSAWYKSHITNKRILTGQVGVFLVLCLSFKNRHLFESVSVGWPSNLSDLNVVSSFTSIGIVLCFAIHMTVLFISIKSYPPMFNVDHHISLRRMGGNSPDDSQIMSLGDEEIFNNISSPFVKIGEDRVSRMDLEGARLVSGSLLCMMLLSTPTVLLLVILDGCLQCGSQAELSDCTRLAQYFYYSLGLISAHCCFISPFCVVFFCREINSALKERFSVYFSRIFTQRN